MASEDESSDLSSAPSDIEMEPPPSKDGILKFFSKLKGPAPAPKRKDSTPPRVREPSPAHEQVLADNPDFAFLVMYRSRFNEAFPKSLPNFGPQELERDIVDDVPGEPVEAFLCAVLSLLLNRKQDVKPGHYNRALEDAVNTHKSHWPRSWEMKSPLSGGASFKSMLPTQRLALLHQLALWSLSSSEAIRSIINTSYKQSRHEDDLNQPLSVQPWGSDADRRRYWLIEGLDDTHFRVYRESSHLGTKRTWWSVAGDIDGLKTLADKLVTNDGGQKARTLSTRITNALPRFEATEEKRKRREYRQARKAAFRRPEPGFSNYEGRTRGKRMRYTYSDNEDEDDGDYDVSEAPSRRSARNTGTSTPAEHNGVTVTASGRQVRSRLGRAHDGTSVHGATRSPASSITGYDIMDEAGSVASGRSGRPRRRASITSRNGYKSTDALDEDEDDASEADYGDDEKGDGDHVPAESDDEDDEEDVEDAGDESELDELTGQSKSLVVKLKVSPPRSANKVKVKLNISPGRKEHDEDTKPAVNADGERASALLSSPSAAKENIAPRTAGLSTSEATSHTAAEARKLGTAPTTVEDTDAAKIATVTNGDSIKDDVPTDIHLGGVSSSDATATAKAKPPTSPSDSAIEQSSTPFVKAPSPPLSASTKNPGGMLGSADGSHMTTDVQITSS